MNSFCSIKTNEVFKELLNKTKLDAVTFTSIFPYIADIMDKEGMIIKSIDNIDAIQTALLENYSELTPRIESLVETYEVFQQVEFTNLKSLISTSDNTGLEELYEKLDVVPHDLTDANNAKSLLYEDIAFQIVDRMLHDDTYNPTEEQLKEWGYKKTSKQTNVPVDNQQMIIDFVDTYAGYFEGGGASFEHDYNIPENDEEAANIIRAYEYHHLGMDDAEFTFDMARAFVDMLKKYSPQQYEKDKKEFLAKYGSKYKVQFNTPVFTESTGDYRQRTIENITWSDITIDFAIDDKTLGEKLTEGQATKQGKFVSDFAPHGFDMSDIERRARNVFVSLTNDQAYGHKGIKLNTKNIKLNIAGNGIYTLAKHNTTQEQANDYVTAFIQKLIDLGITISEIRSGGQTGIDEAGIIAAQRLGIKCSVHAPKGWKFRDMSGKDISNEQSFKARFGSDKNQAPQQQSSQKRIATKDGKIVLTQEQQDAVNHTVEFIKNKFKNKGEGKPMFLTIQGMAGTGKTTIVSSILEQLKKDRIHPSTAVAAVSRKAVKVLHSKLQNFRVKAESVYTLAGADPNQSEDKFAIDSNNNKFNRYNLIFIDEASMIGPTTLKAFTDYVAEHPSTCIVFLGDYGQLRPIVKEGESFEGKSKVFSGDNFQIETLTERIRQGEDSPILAYADKFYDVSVGKSNDSVKSKLSGNTIVTSEGALIVEANGYNTEQKLFELFQEAYNLKNPEYAKIVTARRNTAAEWNKKIHDFLHPDETNREFSVGDLIIFNTAFADIDNASEGIVKALPTEIKTTREGIEYEEYVLQIENFGTFPIKRMINTPANRQRYEARKEELWIAAKANKNMWPNFYAFTDQFADFSLGYAITSHKAQGSTYDISVVDANDINTMPWSNQGRAESMYTAITRSRNVTIVLSDTNGGVDVPSYKEVNSNIETNKTGVTPVTSTAVAKLPDMPVDNSNPFEAPVVTTPRQINKVEVEKPAVKELADYTAPIQDTPVRVQQDKVYREMTIQEKNDAVKLISKWFISYIDQTIEAYENEDLRDKMLRTGKSLIATKAIQEALNRQLLDAIDYELSFDNPSQKVIEKLAENVIPLTELDYIRFVGIDEIKQDLIDGITAKVEQNPKMQAIVDNFDALFLEAASLINKNYGIDIVGNLDFYNEQENTDIDDDDQSQSDKNVEDSPANDYTRSDDRSRSTESILTQKVKRIYDRCIVRGKDGNAVQTSFNTDATIDSSLAHTKMLRLTKDIIDFDDMMSLIANSKETWINSVDENGGVREGCLRYFLENNPQLANEFYYNYKGSAQENAVIAQDEDGVFRITSVNSINSSKQALKTITSTIEAGYILNKKDSIYTTKGEINKNGCEVIAKEADRLSKLSYETLTPQDYSNIFAVFNALGISLPEGFNIQECLTVYTHKTEPTNVDLTAALRDVMNVCKDIATKAGNKERTDIDLVKEYRSYYTKLTEFIYGASIELAESSHTEGGKTYNTYGKTNYLDELIKILKRPIVDKKTADGKDYYDEEIQAKFGVSTFFRQDGKWLNDWLDKLTRTEDRYQELLKRVNVINSSVTGEKQDYAKWSEATSALSNFLAYYNAPDFKLSSDNEKAAYYRMTIASDSPAGDYIRFVKYVDSTETSYKSILLDKFWNLCKQELIRMEEVSQHLDKRLNGEATTPNIASYDAKIKDGVINEAGGMIFTFMPRLNYVKVGDNHAIFAKIAANGHQDIVNSLAGGNFIDVIRKLDAERNNLGIDENDIKGFFQEIFLNDFNKDFEEEFKEFEKIASRANISQLNDLKNKGKLKEVYREYSMNFQFAFTQLVQLTCTDMAFYGKRKVSEVKNIAESNFIHNGKYYKIVSDNALEVFQKRNKEIHAPTKHIHAKKEFREVVVADHKVMSEIISNVKAAIINNKHLSKAFKDNIIAAFEEIDVSDGQSYRSLESYMELLESLGKLDDETRECFNNILHGKFDEGNFYKVALAIKPYFYSTLQTERDTYDKNGKRNIIMRPNQHKNSEYPLMAVTIAAGALGNSKVLKGLNLFMKDNNIDVVHFDSVVKVGGQLNLDLSQTLDSPKKIADDLTSQIFDANGNEINVDKIPTSGWGIQTNKDEHLMDKQQLIGSQPRRLVFADIPEFTIDKNGNLTEYKIAVTGSQDKKNGKGSGNRIKNYTKAEFLKHYQEIISEDIIQAFTSVDSMFKDINVLSRFLQENVATSDKYDDDMIQMFSVNDKKNGFVLPFWDATVSNKVEELLNSVIKNRVVKQKIKGGAVVQTAAVGLTKELNVRYRKLIKDENGDVIGQEIIPTYSEWLQKNPKGNREQYENTVAKDAVVAYMECYLPLWSKDFIEAYMGTDGKLNTDKFPEELKYLIGYRVPTEDHYSMCPLKVVGFLSPTEASSIVLPADITAIAGSDFDIDVLYLMLPEHKLHKYNMKKAKEDFAKTHTGGELKSLDVTEDDITSHSREYEAFNRWFNLHKFDVDENGNEIYVKPKEDWIFNKVQYDHSKSPKENSKEARHNEFINMIFGCLTSEHSLEKFTNPGNYNEHKIASRIIEMVEAGYDYNELLKKLASFEKDTDKIGYLDGLRAALNKAKNIASPKTATDLHQQNMIGMQLVGIFAVANALQQIFEQNPLYVTRQFVINNNDSLGTTSKNNDDVTNQPFVIGRSRNAHGQLITKNIAGYLAASVDNGKDPIMKALKANPDTASYILYLSMLGYTPLEIGAFMSIPSIRARLFADVVYDEKLADNPRVKKLMENPNIKNLSLESMLNAARNPESEESIAVSQVALDAFAAVQAGSDIVSKYYNQLLRADSSNGNVSKSLTGAYKKDKIFMSLLNQYNAAHKKKDGKFIVEPFKKGGSIIPVRYLGARGEREARRLIANSTLPYLQAFVTCGIEASIDWLDRYTLYSNMSLLLNNYIISTERGEASTDRMVRKAFSEFQMWNLLRTPLFGAENDKNITYADKMNYYTKQFPNEFIKWKEDHPEMEDNLFIQNIIFVKENSDKADSFAHLYMGDLGTSKYARKQIKLEFDKLMNEYPDMAIKLFVYSAYRNGLSFSPQGWCHLVSTNAKLQIPGYVDNVRDLKTIECDEAFVEMFIRNNYRSMRGLVADETSLLDTIEEYMTNPDSNNVPTVLYSLPKYFKAANRLFTFKVVNDMPIIEEIQGLGRGKFYHEYTSVSIFDQTTINNQDNEDVEYDVPDDNQGIPSSKTTESETEAVIDEESEEDNEAYIEGDDDENVAYIENDDDDVAEAYFEEIPDTDKKSTKTNEDMC